MGLDVSLVNDKGQCVFECYVTHNLNKMANEAGIYEVMWRPDEIMCSEAQDIAEKLMEGLQSLIRRKWYFEQFNPSNGFGDYEGFVSVVTKYATACFENPTAKIEVSR